MERNGPWLGREIGEREVVNELAELITYCTVVKGKQHNHYLLLIPRRKRKFLALFSTSTFALWGHFVFFGGCSGHFDPFRAQEEHTVFKEFKRSHRRFVLKIILCKISLSNPHKQWCTLGLRTSTKD